MIVNKSKCPSTFNKAMTDKSYRCHYTIFDEIPSMNDRGDDRAMLGVKGHRCPN